MKTFRNTLTALAAMASVAVAAPAFADAILLDSSDIGQSFNFSYNGFASGTPINGLTSQASFKLTNITSTGYVFDYSVANTSSSGVNSRVSSFAFNVDPTISGASSTGTFGNTVLNSNYPNGIGTVDVCFKGGGSNACGGNSGGVLTGDTGSGTFTLSFASAPTSINLSDFFVRYQSISGAGAVTSASGAGTVTSTSTSSSSGGTPVPEPGMILLFGLALVGLGLARSRVRPFSTRPRGSLVAG